MLFVRVVIPAVVGHGEVCRVGGHTFWVLASGQIQTTMRDGDGDEQDDCGPQHERRSHQGHGLYPGGEGEDHGDGKLRTVSWLGVTM